MKGILNGIALCGLLAGCGAMDLVGLGGSSTPEAAQRPANATEYRCAGGIGFWLRPLEGGAMWLIAPDRELRVDAVKGATGARYAVGRVELTLNGEAAELIDPPTKFTACKKAPAPKS